MCFVEKRNPEPFNTNEYIARTGVQDLVFEIEADVPA
jgi:hypothetical protein